jgi:hypothetical protein
MSETEKAIKPDRAPDFIASYGSCFWFEENVYMNALGELFEMRTDQESGTLHVWPLKRACKQCTPCQNKQICERNTFHPSIQKARDEWWYKIFDSKFLGE